MSAEKEASVIGFFVGMVRDLRDPYYFMRLPLFLALIAAFVLIVVNP